MKNYLLNIICIILDIIWLFILHALNIEYGYRSLLYNDIMLSPYIFLSKLAFLKYL